MGNAPKMAWGLSNGAGRDADGGVFREIFGTRGLQGKTLDRDVYERALKKAGQSLRRTALSIPPK